MTRHDHIIKWIVYALGAIPVWLIETTVLSRLPLFGIIPVLLPLAAVAAALFEGARAGAIYGLCVGVVADAVYPGTPGGMILALAVIGWLTGILGQYRVRQTFVGYFLCSAMGMLLLEAVHVLVGLITRLGSATALLRTAGMEAAWSLVFTLPVYGLYKLIYAKVGGDKLGGNNG